MNQVWDGRRWVRKMDSWGRYQRRIERDQNGGYLGGGHPKWQRMGAGRGGKCT